MSKNAKKWTPNQLKTQAWLALPSDMRDPPKQYGLAKKLGVAETTISRWKKLPGWDEEVSAMALAIVRDGLPDVLKTAIKEAKKGSHSWGRLVLQMAGLLVEKTESKIKHDGPIIVNWGDDIEE